MRKYKIIIIHLVLLILLIIYNQITTYQIVNKKIEMCFEAKSKQQIPLCIEDYPIKKRSIVFKNYKIDSKLTMSEEIELINLYLTKKEIFNFNKSEEEDLKFILKQRNKSLKINKEEI